MGSTLPLYLEFNFQDHGHLIFFCCPFYKSNHKNETCYPVRRYYYIYIKFNTKQNLKDAFTEQCLFHKMTRTLEIGCYEQN